jgi:hypothetical protein
LTYLKTIIKGLIRRIRQIWVRRYYLLTKVLPLEVPVHSVSWVPDGFTNRKIAATGVRVIDNFCTAEESAWLINSARNVLQSANADVAVNDVASTGVLALAGADNDDAILTLLYRSSILLDVPYTHASRIMLARCRSDSAVDILSKHAPAGSGKRQHVVMIFLNEVPGDMGGDTVFEGLKFAASPRVGRALCWTRDAAAGTADILPHELPPVSEDSEKWVLQLWFLDYPLLADLHEASGAAQARKGEALTGDEEMPAGVWAPLEVDLEGVFGEPDKLKGLV